MIKERSRCFSQIDNWWTMMFKVVSHGKMKSKVQRKTTPRALTCGWWDWNTQHPLWNSLAVLKKLDIEPNCFPRNWGLGGLCSHEKLSTNIHLKLFLTKVEQPKCPSVELVDTVSSKNTKSTEVLSQIQHGQS
jgi:hypothetical protein